MTPNEVAALLTYASALDPRVRRTDAEQRQLQVAAWHAQMAEVPVSGVDMRDVVNGHYARSGADALMPADVAGRVRALRLDRVQRADLDPPPGLDPDDTAAYQRWMLAALRAAADGRPLPPRTELTARPVAELVASVAERLAAVREPYVPRQQRPVTRRTGRGPRTDDDRAASGRAVTVCFECAVDIPVPSGWDPANPDSPPLFCDRHQPGRRAAS